MEVLKSYSSSERDRVYYTLEVLGKKEVPSTVIFYKIEVTKDGYPSKQSILELKISGKKSKQTMVLVQDLIKTFKVHKDTTKDK